VQLSAELAGNEVLFRVEDSGSGIPGDHWERVFEKFKQVGDTLTEKPQGTGLGLPICRRILNSMGGRIWCERSKTLGGAQLAFTLPVSKGRVENW
ncbi:MAG: sensor histidine kinase, partial [Planctomycetota bacterium]